MFHQEGKNQILFVAKNISVTSAYYFRNDWKYSQSQSGYVHGIINLEKPLQLLLDIPLFVIFSKPSKRNRNMFGNILLLELFILIWLSQKNIFWSIKWPLKVWGKNERKKTKTIFFFLQHLQVFFLKQNWYQPPLLFCTKKALLRVPNTSSRSVIWTDLCRRIKAFQEEELKE